ncbi:MAG: mltG [Herbinix sp.]|jgi:uncharacterized YceG family protein|nr:mltG [Herbinix sp.]
MKDRRSVKRSKFYIIGIIFAFIIVSSTLLLTTAQAVNTDVQKQYGIIIVDKNGRYTFYDFNSSTDGAASIELTKTGNIMIPLKKLCELIPELTFSYNSGKKTATVVNHENGKKIVYTLNNSSLNYYSGPKAKASKKSMTYKMYISKNSSAVMVHMSSLKWVLNSPTGYHYYKTEELQMVGFDTSLYSGIVAYNPYQVMNALPKAMNVKGISSTVKVTIPEGYAVAQIYELLMRKGVVPSTEVLYDAMENYDFSYYPLVSEITDENNRCFRLEGYLYPDTYEFFRLSKGEDVIGKFLRNAETRITKADRQKAADMDLGMYEILTIASMIEKETADPKLMPLIASVIFNRLENGMKLQFDSSIFYVERYIKPYIEGDINRYNSFYNTYKCAALPVGPICNPGKTAIQAALNPADTDYFFFYSDEAGEYHFSVEYVNPKALTPTPTETPETDLTPIPTLTPALAVEPTLTITQ